VTTCRFAIDDGAYILGALAPSDRADFDRHLPTCPTCRGSVARLAVLPGLLGRLDAEGALEEVQAPASLLPRVLAAAAVRRRADRLRRRWYSVAAGLVAASLATVVGIGVHMADMADISTAEPPVAFASMSPPPGRELPVSAEVRLIEIPGGTRVEMHCRYTEDEDGRWTVRLVVYPRFSTQMEQVGSWVAYAGQEVAVNGTTHLTPAQIGIVELQKDDHSPLLSWQPA